MSISEPNKISVTVSRAEFDATTVTISVAEYAALCRLRDAAARCAGGPMVLHRGEPKSWLRILVNAQGRLTGFSQCFMGSVLTECGLLADEIERHRCELGGEPKRCGEVGE